MILNRSLITTCLVFVLALLTTVVSAIEYNYSWQQKFYGKLNGKKALLFSHEMPEARLAFVDIDSDGDPDLFVGRKNGKLAFFENRGKLGKPDFQLITQEYRGIYLKKDKKQTKREEKPIDVGEMAAPTFADLDKDGDMDLLIGSQKGSISFFRNEGSNLIPEFVLISRNYSKLKLGTRTTPFLKDVNKDRMPDLLVGNAEGEVYLLNNEGLEGKSKFIAADARIIGLLENEINSVPTLFDWDNDGDLDLLVGKRNGEMAYFENAGNPFVPAWKIKDSHFQLIDIGGEAAPATLDIDNDGDQDLFIANLNPTVNFYQNRSVNDKRVFWSRTDNYFNFQKFILSGNRAALTMGDVDKDGDLDLIVGEENGNLNYYLNQGTKLDPDWVLQTENLIPIVNLKNSSPLLHDLDADGDLDLLIGSKSGKVAFAENMGTATKPDWVLKNQNYFNIDVGSNSVPRMKKVTGLKYKQLFLGNYEGSIVEFEKTKKQEITEIKIKSISPKKEFYSNSVPVFFDYNLDGQADLIRKIVAPANTSLAVILADATADVSKIGNSDLNQSEITWSIKDIEGNRLQMDPLSNILFVDFDNNGKKDLLHAGLSGDVQFFSQLGVTKTEKKLEVPPESKVAGQNFIEIPVEEKDTISADIIEQESPDQQKKAEILKNIIVDPVYKRAELPAVIIFGAQKLTPTLGDIDGDGYLDMIVGSRSGRLFFFSNESDDPKNWEFRRAEQYEKQLPKLKNQRNTVPVLVDLDKDGDLDLVVANGSGYLKYFENQGTVEDFNFQEIPGYFYRLKMGTNPVPAFADLDRDGDLDIIAGNMNGKILLAVNQSEQGKGFELLRTDYLGIDVGLSSTPTLFDLNGDKEKELIIGSDRGRLFFYNSNGKVKWNWKNLLEKGQSTTLPKASFPAFVDLDSDGDLDLLLAGEGEKIMIYLNQAISISSNEQNEE